MKTHTIVSRVAVSLALLAGVPAVAAPTTDWAPVDHVYSPKGFDTNDDTQVIVSGYLPNLCYKAPQAEVSLVGKTIAVTVKALLNEDVELCAQMVVPFLLPVSVGVLDKGTYRVVVNGGSRFERTSSIQVVESASSAVDNFVYANLDYVEKAPGSRRVLLKGYNPSDCFVFDRIELISNERDTFSILPIMKQVRESCPMKMVPLTIPADIPASLDPEQILLHVRVMNGKSVNALFDNR